MNGRKLTENFAQWEFTVSETAARRGIPNVPSDVEWDSLRTLATTCLEPARIACGPLHINSGYRSPVLNFAVGGANASQHTKGEAVDVVPFHGTLADLFKWFRANVPFDQLIWEFNEWVHLSHSAVREQRGEILRATRVNGVTRYVPMTDDQINAL